MRDFRRMRPAVQPLRYPWSAAPPGVRLLPPARSDRLRMAMNGTRLAQATCATAALSMSGTRAPNVSNV